MFEITNINDAYKRIHEDLPGWKILKAVDYNEYFVFDAVPKNYNVEKDGPYLSGLTCVRKSDGKVFGFNPLVNNPKMFFRVWENNNMAIEGGIECK